MVTVDTLLLLIPALSLVSLGIWVIVASAFQSSRWWAGFCALVLLIVAYGMLRQDIAIWHGIEWQFGATDHLAVGPIFVDAFGHLGRWMAITLALLFLPLMTFATKPRTSGESLGVMMFAFAGLMVVAVAADLTLLLLGLELVSIPTYVLLFLGRSDHRSPEATAKYFFLSILASAVFLYGLSFLYGASGSTHLLQIQSNLQSAQDAVGGRFLPFAVILVLVGVGFKVAAVPFHFYAPDVYQATTHGNASLLAILPKAAGLFALIRISVALAPAVSDLLIGLLMMIAVASMTLGNVCALWQSDLRRLLAYSSIAHAGYMLIGVAAGLASGGNDTAYNGFGASVLYLIVYSGASLGAFAILAYLSNAAEEVRSVDQLQGLPRRHPVAALCLTVCLFSLNGIPPLAGFWGKLTLFTSALAQARPEATFSTWFTGLLIVAALNVAVAASYYLRVIAKMYFGSPESDEVPTSYGVSLLPGLTAGGCVLIVVAIGLHAGSIVNYSRNAGQSVQWTDTPRLATADVQSGEDGMHVE